ncbi:MAG TPA: FAD binding domain-containing protein [Terriglobia bacterium]|nr:FAD binding domain-containing protein [Terriglobia bacterium]
MRAFEYAHPNTKEEVVQLLSSEWGETEILAGGTDLISLMKDEVATPKRLVSLKHVKGLKGIEFKSATGLRIGAMTTFEDVLDNGDIRHHYAGIVQAVEGVTSPQIRSVGTVGGDLLQRPRCWYFRGGFGLLAERDGKSLVPGGDNRYHAILGNSGPAYFVNPSSLAPILIALGAKVRVQGPQGPREIELDKFFVTPTSAQEREYTLKPNELLTEILVPPADGARSAVYEVRQKEALDWPLAAAAVVLHLDGHTVKSARVVLGHVAPVPWPSPEAEQTLAGKVVNEESAVEAGKVALAKATPLSRNAYKVQLARVAVKRAILRAAKGEA